MPETIVALATPTGHSGIGVIRASGADALKLWRGLTGRDTAPQPRRATLVTLQDREAGEAIDEALVTYFRARNSFTGEDVLEISCHGSPVVLRQVLDACLSLGARLAEPGEFSLRALANGRMDLAEAEAIRDLIEARTTASARQAVRQMRGEFSHELQPIKNELLDVIVILESALEFVEDDLPETAAAAVTSRLSELVARVNELAATFKAGRLIRDGLRVALVGRPNVGKSSLFNALLGTDRAIVTAIAGTTRDQLHEAFTINEIPISLIDTAGLRETSDTIESIGVERSKRAMADADLVIVMVDASEHLTTDDRDILESVSELPNLIVFNKIDKLPAYRQSCPLVPEVETLDRNAVFISAKTGEGLDKLKKAIVDPFSPTDTNGAGFLVSDARHHDLLRRAFDDIENSIVLFEAKISEEIVLVGLHNALRYLGEITGETTSEDMLTRIFSTFCIGK
jgi:tRNA modification GTPase